MVLKAAEGDAGLVNRPVLLLRRENVTRIARATQPSRLGKGPPSATPGGNPQPEGLCGERVPRGSDSVMNDVGHAGRASCSPG